MIVQVEFDKVILKSETHAERCQLSFIAQGNKFIDFRWEDDMEAVMTIRTPEVKK
jgi:hypothetical protein